MSEKLANAVIEILETALDEGARRERERIRGEVEKLRELREEVKAKVEREQSIDIVYYYSGALWALEMVLKYLENC